jgi:hypothetical protein
MADPGTTHRRTSEWSEVDGLAEAKRLIEVGGVVGIPLRLVGGLAVQARSLAWRPGARLQRDIDLAARRRDKSGIVDLLDGLGYRPDRRFNALHGHKQLYFVNVTTGVPIDIILDSLAMCHRLDFADRLQIHPVTLSLADLLLSKLQIVRITRKDLVDILALLHEHPLTRGDETGINLERIARIIGEDWGWWRTVTGNLERAIEAVRSEMPLGSEPLSQASRRLIEERLAGLQFAVDETPKSRRWKLRARIGERVRWYEEPEEEEHR